MKAEKPYTSNQIKKNKNSNEKKNVQAWQTIEENIRSYKKQTLHVVECLIYVSWQGLQCIFNKCVTGQYVMLFFLLFTFKFANCKHLKFYTIYLPSKPENWESLWAMDNIHRKSKEHWRKFAVRWPLYKTLTTTALIFLMNWRLVCFRETSHCSSKGTFEWIDLLRNQRSFNVCPYHD